MVLALCALCAGCPAPQQNTPKPEQNNTAPSVADKKQQEKLTPTPAPSMNAAPARPATQLAEVKRVVDGDTIRIRTGERVRYIGVDTPELARNGEFPEYYSGQATTCNQTLLGKGPVKLVFDVERTDKYGRLLAYVYAGPGFKTFVNAKLVEMGCAKALTIPPNVRHAEEFQRLEQQARSRNLGLWAD